jgi:hypothetical protein
MDLLLVAVVLGGILFFIWLGHESAKGELSADEADIDVQRKVLQEQWAALESARQVNDVLFEARDEMRRAANARRRPGQRR